VSPENTDAAVLEALGERLRQTRLARNLSQAALAEEAGVGRETVVRIESGRSASLISLIRLLRALGLLEGLNELVPELGPSPIDQLRRQRRRRQRAGSSRSRSPEDEAHPWRWGNERKEGRE